MATDARHPFGSAGRIRRVLSCASLLFPICYFLVHGDHHTKFTPHMLQVDRDGGILGNGTHQKVFSTAQSSTTPNKAVNSEIKGGEYNGRVPSQHSTAGDEIGDDDDYPTNNDAQDDSIEDDNVGGWDRDTATNQTLSSFRIKEDGNMDSAADPLDKVDWGSIPCPGHTEPWHSCDLADFHYGRPVILISAGRSGSSVTWGTMTALASEPVGRGTKPRELPGNTAAETMEQLHKLDSNEHGKCWMQRMLCGQQFKNQQRKKKKQSKLIGTKWKPSLEVFNHTKVKQALDWIAHSPFIKVIYNERNPLDVAISGFKHQQSSIPTHCKPDDQECLNAFLAQDMMEIPTHRLIQLIAIQVRHGNGSLKIMNEKGVAHVRVSYERLFYGANGTNVCEWRRLLSHVTEQSWDDLTQAEIQAHMTYVATHPKTRAESIGNYAEIVAALEGTQYAKYLVPPTEPVNPDHECSD